MKDLLQQSQCSGRVRCRSSCVLRAVLSLMFALSLALLALVVGSWFVLLFALSFAGCEVLLLAGMCRGRGGRGEWVVLCVLWLSLWGAIWVVVMVLCLLSVLLPRWAWCIPLCLVPVGFEFWFVLAFALSFLPFLFLGEWLWKDVCELDWVCE